MTNLTPTAEEIRMAGLRWCGDKERETFLEDEVYFRENWAAFPGLNEYVVREVAKRAEPGLRNDFKTALNEFIEDFARDPGISWDEAIEVMEARIAEMRAELEANK